ncbi:hypothetical protein LPJ77_004523 [Coemansia sp. RSA 2523]|nr:hypothetical protein LPJ77_004523 [Coemansia sp. RSA 2523]
MFSLVLKLFTNIARVLFANADIPDIIYPLPCVPVEGLVEQTTFYDFIIYYLIFTMIFGLKFYGVRTVVAGSVRRSDSGMAAVIANEPATAKGELVDEPADGQTELADEPNIAQTSLTSQILHRQTSLTSQILHRQTSKLQHDPVTITNLAREIAATQAELIALDCESQSNSDATAINYELADTQTESSNTDCELHSIYNPIAVLVKKLATTQAELIITRAELAASAAVLEKVTAKLAAKDAELTIANNKLAAKEAELTIANNKLAAAEPEVNTETAIKQEITMLMSNIAARQDRMQATKAKLEAVRAESKRFRENRLLLENSKNLAVAAVQRDAHLHAEPSHSAPALQKPAQDGDVPPTV